MSGQNWQYLADGQPGAPVRANGGAGYQAIGFRDVLDARRSMLGQRVPSAEYPDGYLGTITDRRQDRLLQGVKERLTQRSYQRGVHKGEKVDQRDYFWTDEVNPEIGLQYEARGQKWTARGELVDRLVNDGKGPVLTPSQMSNLTSKYGVRSDSGELVSVDPIRQERMRRLSPSWR